MSAFLQRALDGFWERQQAREAARKQRRSRYSGPLPLCTAMRRKIEPTFQTPQTYETWQRIRRIN